MRDTQLTSAADAERVSPAFSTEGMLRARAKTRQAIRDIAARIRPGMVEEDAVEMAKQVLADAGMALSWHPVRVRFGRNTLKAMKRASEPGVVLQENDIFFVDIAPRFEEWEGDGGASFAVGTNPQYQQCALDAAVLFHDVREVWQRDKLTGQQLYEYADARARAMGWELNWELNGHRISDFPHAAVHTGSLSDASFPPSAMRWILEIHIRHPSEPYGAFFEDMLLDDGDYSPD